MSKYFRVGKKRKRAVLYPDGRELIVFPEGLEDEAQKYVDFLNKKHHSQFANQDFNFDTYVYESLDQNNIERLLPETSYYLGALVGRDWQKEADKTEIEKWKTLYKEQDAIVEPLSDRIILLEAELQQLKSNL